MNQTARTITNEHLIAALCHICPYAGWLPSFLLFKPLIGFSILPPIIIWALYRSRSELIAEEGRQVINYQISANFWIMLLGLLLATVSGFSDPMAKMSLSFLFGIAFILFALIYLVLGLVATFMTANKRSFHYPFIFQIIK